MTQRARRCALSAAAASIAVGAVAGVAAAPVAASPASPAPVFAAPAAPQKIAFTLRLSLRDIDEVKADSRVGSRVVGRGSLTDASTGSQAGTFTSVGTVVAVENSRRDVRNERARVELSGGDLYAETIASTPRGARPDVALIMPIVGGTGEYRSVRGTVTMIPAGSTYILAVDALRAGSPERSRLGFDRTTEVRTESAAPGALGSTIVRTAPLRGGGDLRMVLTLLDRTAAGLVYDVQAGVVTPRWTLQFRGRAVQARPERPAPITLAVIGGTGAYAGIRGEGRWTVARTGSRLDLELAKVAGGRTEGLMWVESDTRTQSTAVPGGDFLGGIGSLKGKGPDGRFSGQVMIGMGLLRAGVDAPQVEATVIEHQLPGGTILIAGVTGSGQWPLVRPVVGGTGEYAGAIGTATLERVREGVYRKTVAIWR